MLQLEIIAFIICRFCPLFLMLDLHKIITGIDFHAVPYLNAVIP